MSSEWRETTLGEVIELKRGYDLPQAQRTQGAVPIVSSSGVSDFHNKAMVKAPGVVTGRYGTIGQVFYIDKDFWPLNTSLYVRDFKGNDPKFISYLLKTIDFFAYSDKGAVPGVNRNHLHMAQVRIPLPENQRAIADILGTLDDKISLNRQINQTLEQMVQAIFKSWFVDFDPVRAKMAGRQPEGMDAETAALFPDEMVESELGLVPKGWSLLPLYETAEYVNGAVFKSDDFSHEGDGLPIIKIAELKQGISGQTKFTTKTYQDKYFIESGNIFYSWSGSPETSLDVFKWFGGEGWLNQHIFKLNFSSIEQQYFTYYLLEYMRPVLVQTAMDKQTTGLGHVTVADMKRIKVIYPDQSVLKAFALYVSSLYEQSSQLEMQTMTLAALRDNLLPKLLSGEISVNEAA